MAYLKLDKKKLEHNYKILDAHFKSHQIEWATVSKILCGNKPFLKELINLGTKEICDSRISNLQKIKEIDPEIQTVYIKPPAQKLITEIVKYADLREGVMGEDLMAFYGEIFKLSNIEIVGIGANLNCLSGVMPSADKLIQLSLYKQLIEATFNKKIPWVSGGTSVVIPLMLTKQLPKGINHFRIGETLFFGVNLFTNELVEGMHGDVFKFYAQIIELNEKPLVPTGVLDENPSGDVFEINEEDYGKTSTRAILDVGLLDIEPNFLEPDDKSLEITGASSDMVVIDLGKNSSNYKVGDILSFNVKYMGALGLLNSNYIEKIVA
jgi:predicted amino acid racemase